MTTTFHAILLGLGLLAIWAWLKVTSLKIKFNVVISERAKYLFELETRFLRVVMWLIYYSAQVLIVGSIIRILRGV